MKNLLKTMVVGTFLEPLAIKAHSLFMLERDNQDKSAAVALNRLYGIQTIEVMKRVLQKDSNCIDVGCHQGSILREALSLSPEGTHFAFEPLSGMYQELQELFGSVESLHIYDLALSDSAGVSTYQHVLSNPGYSGLRKRSYDRLGEQIQEISVKTELLDKLIPADMPIHFIKADVEGAEFQVFKGATDIIKRSRPDIVFEHGLGAADHYGTSVQSRK